MLSLAERGGYAAFTPHSSWERDTNQNTNGLIREYVPKGTMITGG